MHSAYRIPAVLRYNAIERGRSVSVHKESFTPGFALHRLLRARGAEGKFRIEFYVLKSPYLSPHKNYIQWLHIWVRGKTGKFSKCSKIHTQLVYFP